MQDLLAAIALVLILEGLLPFAAPGTWKRALAQLAAAEDRQLRWLGFGSMMLGLLLLGTVRG